MRTPTGTLLRAGLTAVVSLALVAGCSDDPKPGTLKTPAATPTSTTASPTPTTPEAQIEAAVRAYYAELTRGIQTSNADRLRPLVTKGCPCFNAVTTIETNAAKGRRGPDARVNVHSIRVHDLDGRLALAEVHYDVNAYPLVNEKGQVLSRIPARSDLVDLSVVQNKSGQWIVANVFDLGDA